MLQFRDLSADTLNKLVRVPGIVISTSVLSSRATRLHLRCKECGIPKDIIPPNGLGGLGGGADRGLPRQCDAAAPPGQTKDCPLDPYLIDHDHSAFADHQTLKLQEAPDMVPVGELPRHMLLSADRYLAGRVVPGSRVIATGIYSTYEAQKSVCYRFLSRNLPLTSEKCRKTPQALLLSEIRTYEYSTLSSRLRPRTLLDQIRLVYNLRRRKKRNLG